MKKLTLHCVLATLTLSAATAGAATDYFVINRGDNSVSHIFTYDTVAKTISEVGEVTWTLSGSNGGQRVTAGLDGAFWTGESGSSVEGVERWIPNNDLTAWSNDFAINVAGTGGTSSDPVGPGAGELANGIFMAADMRNSHFGAGAVNSAWSGTQSASTAFLTTGTLSPTLGSTGVGSTAADIATTIAGSSNRFILTSNLNNSDIVVYEGDATPRDTDNTLTNLTNETLYSAIGTMKTAAMGDVVLQLSSGRSLSPTITIQGRYVDDANFDNVAISSFTVPQPGSGPIWIEGTDVDGTQSGLIMVVGMARGTAGDSIAVQFFNTDGTAHSGMFYMRDYDIGLATGTASTYSSGAGLYFAPVPEPATVALLTLGGLGLAATARRRRTR